MHLLQIQANSSYSDLFQLICVPRPWAAAVSHLHLRAAGQSQRLRLLWRKTILQCSSYCRERKTKWMRERSTVEKTHDTNILPRDEIQNCQYLNLLLFKIIVKTIQTNTLISITYRHYQFSKQGWLKNVWNLKKKKKKNSNLMLKYARFKYYYCLKLNLKHI